MLPEIGPAFFESFKIAIKLNFVPGSPLAISSLSTMAPGQAIAGFVLLALIAVALADGTQQDGGQWLHLGENETIDHVRSPMLHCEGTFGAFVSRTL